MMTLIFVFSKDWVCVRGVEFLQGKDLIDVMHWIQGHNFDDFSMKIGDCADGYRIEVDVDC